MASYSTIDYLPDLTVPEMIDARELVFKPYTPTISGLDWDFSSEVYGDNDYALLHHNYYFNAVEGATYDIFSTSFYDPYLLRVFDKNGNTIIVNEENDDGTDFYLVNAYYSRDIIFDWVAPYSGKYYVSASWNQGTFYTFYGLQVFEDIDTATSSGAHDRTETFSLDVIVESGVLAKGPVLLKDLVETTVYKNGVISEHKITYGAQTFDYAAIDRIIFTVVRNGEFTEEFSQEIANYAPTVGDISYQDAISLVGIQSIDNVIIAVAGADGFYVA